MSVTDTYIDSEPTRNGKEILLSAIVSTYNSESFLRGCLDDLERQTIADRIEIIVVNSNSQQNEEAIVKEYQRKYRNIVYVKTLCREGIYAAWNRAVKIARGKYLTNANTDDRHRPDAFEILTNELEAHCEVGLVWADQIATDTANGTYENCNRTGELKWDAYSRDRLLLGCCIGSQPVWRATVHEEVGYFDETLTCAGDWDFWIRISEKFKLLYVPQYLGSYYRNEEGIEHGRKTHSLYERLVVGQRYGTKYIAVIPYVDGPQYPLVSVIMPAYNAGEYIAEAIESVLIQNYRQFELIVVDDGATDNTAQVVASFKDEKLRYIKKANGGASSARNEGLRQSKGQYVVMLDADDVISPEYILNHLKKLQQHPDADLIYCDDALIDTKSKQIKILTQLEYSSRTDLIRDMFRCAYPLIPARGCMKKSMFDKIGVYDETLLVGEDYDLMRRFLMHNCKAYRLAEPLYMRRMQPQSLCHTPNAAKAQSHFTVVHRFVESFHYRELFPDVKWDQLPQSRHSLYVSYLLGVSYRAIGKNYALSGTPLNAVIALNKACSILSECLNNDPANQQVKILLDQCKSERDIIASV